MGRQGQRRLPDRTYQAAATLWPALVKAAKNRHLLTYGRAESLTGYGKRMMGVPCWLIEAYCRWNDRPPLNALVVNQKARVPGPGIPTLAFYPDLPTLKKGSPDWLQVFERVAKETWNLPCPDLDDLKEAEAWWWATHGKESKPVFREPASEPRPWVLLGPDGRIPERNRRLLAVRESAKKV